MEKKLEKERNNIGETNGVRTLDGGLLVQHHIC